MLLFNNQMQKEDKQFWLYIVGIMVMFFFLFFGVKGVYDEAGIDIFPILGKIGPEYTVVSSYPVGDGLKEGSDYYALVQTNKGEFTIDLFEENAPNTVTNFIYLTTIDLYDGSKFHRLVPGVILQGGIKAVVDGEQESSGAGYTINDEMNWDSLDYSNNLRKELIDEGYTSITKLASKDIAKYRVAMASAGPNSNSSQFFIVIGDVSDPGISGLRGRHTVFGEISENQNIIDEIAAISVTGETPNEELIIEDIRVFQKTSQ